MPGWRDGEQQVKVVVLAATAKGNHTVTVTYNGSATVLSSTTQATIRVN